LGKYSTEKEQLVQLLQQTTFIFIQEHWKIMKNN